LEHPAAVADLRTVKDYGVFIKKWLQSHCVRVIQDEHGGEVLEYALIVGLIIIAAISAIHAVGTKVLAKWTSLNASM
jgi:Flp pilus assembly pilin Flp